MTSLERAKRFLQNKTRTLDLTAAPLPALAVGAIPAQAGVVFIFTNCLVSATNANYAGSCPGGAVATQLNGSNGLHLMEMPLPFLRPFPAV